VTLEFLTGGVGYKSAVMYLSIQLLAARILSQKTSRSCSHYSVSQKNNTKCT